MGRSSDRRGRHHLLLDSRRVSPNLIPILPPSDTDCVNDSPRYLVLVSTPNAALIGYQLNLSFGATGLLLIWSVNQKGFLRLELNDLAGSASSTLPKSRVSPSLPSECSTCRSDKNCSPGNSVERIEQYLNIEHEPAPTAEKAPPASWPTSGTLVVKNLSARYSVDGPTVLQNIGFECRSGEKVGIGECDLLDTTSTWI